MLAKTRADRRKKQVREERKAKNICVICGEREPIEGMVGCDYCYDRQAEYKNDLQHDRRDLGFCVQCNEVVHEINPHTRKKYARCKACRKYNTDSRIALRLRQRELGLCMLCGVLVHEINPKTGLPYSKCSDCGKRKINPAA